MSSSPSRARVTIRDVAAAAGVSTTTVSHALNGKGSVDPATRDRVVEVARELGYRASRAARALRAGRTGTVALLLPEIQPDDGERPALALDYYMRITASAARVAAARRHPLLLAPAPRTAADVADLGVDGAIVVDPETNDARLGLFAAAGLPVATIERDLGRPDHRAYVHSGNAAAARGLLDHLREAGAERVAMLGTEAGWAWVRESEDAYRAWCAEHDVPPRIARTALDALEGSAHDRARELLASDVPPDAIFALAEGSAGGVMRAARELGVRVPAELLVASGIDSVGLRTGPTPVTSIDLRPDRQGAAAAELLFARLDEAADPGPVVVPAKLRVRASTTPSAAA